MQATGEPGIPAPSGSFEHARHLAEVAGRTLEGMPARDILHWAFERFGQGLSVASSFEDLALVALASEVAPGAEVVFLDTGAHFPETWQLVRAATERLAITLKVLVPDPSSKAPPCGARGCCEQRKVQPLARHLRERAAWATGLRRADSPTRQAVPVVAFDERFGVVKVNPLVDWSDEDAEAFVAARGLPSHPLRSKGYRSIGCAPTTAPVQPGEPARAGRWRGQSKTECGLHVPGGEGTGLDDEGGTVHAG